MRDLVNQHQLAAELRRSRASIIKWSKEGMPVERRGGHGRPTLYNVDQVRAWIAQTGRGMRPTLPPMPLHGGERASSLPERLMPELLLARVLEEGMGAIVAMLIAHGIAGELALSVFDGLVVAAYTVLEEHTGQDDSLIPMDGALGLLMNDAGRQSLIAYATRVAEQEGAFIEHPGLAQAMERPN